MLSNKSPINAPKASVVAAVTAPASWLPLAAGCSTNVDCGNAVSLVIATVPDLLGKVRVLSAVGSVTANVVSKLSAVEPSNIKLVTVGLASKAIDISLFETVVVMFEPPEKSKVSVASDTVSFDPLSAPTVKVVVIDAVDTAVTSPFAFTVTTGIAVALPA